MLQRELKSTRRRLRQKGALGDLAVRAVEALYKKQPRLAPPRLVNVDKRKKAPEIAVLHLSDTQIGKVTEGYNVETAASRIMRLAERVAHIAQVRRTYAPVRELRLYLGGDMIEGEQIFAHQAHEIECSVFAQAVRHGPEMLARSIRYLLQEFERVRVVTVPGNHGRNGPRHTSSAPETNWDNVCYEVTRLMLTNADGKLVDGLEFEISESFYAVDRVFTWGNLVVHGDQITGGFAGFPWYGTAKKAWGWIDAIPAEWDYLWFGHFHTYASATLNHRVFLANGTTESANTYAQAQLAAAGHPCQRLAMFNAKRGLVADYPIYLGDDRQSQQQRRGGA